VILAYQFFGYNFRPGEYRVRFDILACNVSGHLANCLNTVMAKDNVGSFSEINIKENVSKAINKQKVYLWRIPLLKQLRT